MLFDVSGAFWVRFGCVWGRFRVRIARVMGIDHRTVGRAENTSNGQMPNAYIPPTDLRCKLKPEHQEIDHSTVSRTEDTSNMQTHNACIPLTDGRYRGKLMAGAVGMALECFRHCRA